MKEIIRRTIAKDIQGIKTVLDSSELFPSEYLDDMISDYLNNEDSEDIWFSCLEDEKVIGFGYCAPEKLTNGTYNLYAIALLKNTQGKGYGSKMIHFIENLLRKNKNRLLIIDTSSSDDYEKTRQFYLNLGYKAEATIKDFWDEGEDKITFSKRI